MNTAVIVACFGSNDELQFNRSFKKIFEETSRANAKTALALLNVKIAEHLKEKTLAEILEEFEGYERVIVLPLLLADGSQYSLIKEMCKADKYDVGLPILQFLKNEIAALLDNILPFEKESEIILLAHGSKDSNNQQYYDLGKLLRTDMQICLLENDSLEEMIKNSNKKKIRLFSLMFTCGHHYQQEIAQFEKYCVKYEKDCFVYPFALGSIEAFQKLLVNKFEEVINA